MPYGHLQKRVEVVLERIGREAVIGDRTQEGEDAFGNPTDSYPDSGNSVRCVRTYPSQNTEASSVAGDTHTDRPLFGFVKDDVPPKEARIEYPEDAETVADATETTIYEMQAPTVYDSHVEMRGDVVVNP